MKATIRKIAYNIRWYVSKKWGDPEAQATVLGLLDRILGTKMQEPDRVSQSEPGQRLAWCPFASRNYSKGKTRGRYRAGMPQGAIVHFTAGHRNGLERGMADAAASAYGYFLIDADGNIGQNIPLTHWAYHAFPAEYRGIKHVASQLVGIEMQCWGKVKKDPQGNWRSWAKYSVRPNGVRTVEKEANREAGTYQIFSWAQEEALISLLIWLYSNDPERFNLDWVLGHDEVSPGRKNDPGGSLSMTMPEFREHLRDRLFEHGGAIPKEVIAA